MKKIVFAVLCFMLCACNSTKSQQASRINWNRDIEYLKNELPKLHKNLFFKLSSASFNEQLNKLEKVTDKLSDIEVGVRLQQIITQVGDAHTGVSLESFLKKDEVLPLGLYWLNDGMYVITTTEAHSNILGTRIISINQHPASTIADSLKTLIVQDNEAMNRLNVPKMILSEQLLSYFHFSKPDSSFAVETINEKNEKITSTFRMGETIENVKKIIPSVIPLCLQNPRALFWDKYVEQDSIYYLQYNKCWSKEADLAYNNGKNSAQLPSIEELEQRMAQTLKEKPVKKMVIDMRYNGGGSEPQGDELAKKIAAINNINKKGKLFIVTGRNTFSSAVLNVVTFKELTNCIVVGEETAGSPNHYGEVKTMTLPSSKLTVSYSTKYFKRTDKDERTIVPDLPVYTSYSDFKAGIDPAYETIKKYK